MTICNNPPKRTLDILQTQVLLYLLCGEELKAKAPPTELCVLGNVISLSQ